MIGGIVDNILNTDDIGQTCWAHLSKPEPSNGAYYDICQTYYTNELIRHNAFNDLMSKRNKLIDHLIQKYSTNKLSDIEFNLLNNLLLVSTVSGTPIQSVLSPDTISNNLLKPGAIQKVK